MADRKNALLLTLMDAVDSLEERLNNFDHVPDEITAIKDDFNTIKITLAKIEGQLSGTKVNLHTTTNFGDVDGDVNIKKDEKHGK